MIPRYQRVLFWILSGAILLMALVLLRGCEQTREKLTRHRDETPLSAPVVTPSETVQLALASDTDGSITLVEREIALPSEKSARAHALLARLIAEYSYKNSAHPIESGPAVDDVFLIDLPLHSHSAAVNSEFSGESQALSGLMAVVNLRGTFADHHASGIESETLTIKSMVGTLYANFPEIQHVRFLVDGRSRETLNGHADLLRTYAVVNTANKPAQGVH